MAFAWFTVDPDKASIFGEKTAIVAACFIKKIFTLASKLVFSHENHKTVTRKSKRNFRGVDFNSIHIGVVCVVSLTPAYCQAFTTWQIILAEKF